MKQSLTLLTIVALLAACNRPATPSLRLQSRWTDGTDILSVDSVTTNYIQCDGWSQHDGGDLLRLSLGTNGSMTELSKSNIGKTGDRVTIQIFGGDTVMVIRTPKGALVDVFQGVPPGEDLGVYIKTNKTQFGLGGGYLDEATSKAVVFETYAPKVNGLTMGSDYIIGTDSYDIIQNVITIGSDSSYSYTVTDTGLNLYQARKDSTEDDNWVRGALAYSLRKTEWPNLSTDSKLQGRYSFASTQPLTFDIVSNFTPRQRRLMRNEVFARYGYRFKSPELRMYFLTQTWYMPSSDDVAGKLTPLEQLNVELLEAYDKR